MIHIKPQIGGLVRVAEFSALYEFYLRICWIVVEKALENLIQGKMDFFRNNNITQFKAELKAKIHSYRFFRHKRKTSEIKIYFSQIFHHQIKMHNLTTANFNSILHRPKSISIFLCQKLLRRNMHSKLKEKNWKKTQKKIFFRHLIPT